MRSDGWWLPLCELEGRHIDRRICLRTRRNVVLDGIDLVHSIPPSERYLSAVRRVCPGKAIFFWLPERTLHLTPRRRFKSLRQVQQFLSVHSPINNLFRVGRHLMKAAHYRLFRERAFTTWRDVTMGLAAA